MVVGNLWMLNILYLLILIMLYKLVVGVVKPIIINQIPQWVEFIILVVIVVYLD